MFDPYRKWLGIPEQSRPPTHYQLLGIQPNETDPDVIRAAVTQRSAYVRNFQAGQHADDATRILNEIAAAEACLTNKAKRAAYDAELKRKEALSKPKPRPAAPQAPPPVPVLDPLLDQMATAMPPPLPVWAAAPQRKTLPIGLIAAIGGGAVLLVVAVMVAMALLGRDEPSNVASSNPPAAASAEPTSTAQVDLPRTSGTPEVDPAATAPPSVSQPTETAGAPDPEPVDPEPVDPEPAAPSPSPPEPLPPLGVVADRVVVWNQHNCESHDRGTKEFHLLLMRDGDIVWRKDRIALPWSADRDTNVAVPIPREQFDCVRVEIVDIGRHRGGGLAEIQVFLGATNLARGCPVTASGTFDERYPAEQVTDGITTSAYGGDGFWLLPNDSTGWIEVDLALPRPQGYTGLEAERVVVWNQHNGAANDRGTREFDLVLLLGDVEVWRQRDVAIAWRANQDDSAAVDLPAIGFDRLRLEIDKTQAAGGLAEVQVFRGGDNIALGARAVPDSVFGGRTEFAANRLTDGVTSSATLGVGYWLSERAAPNSVEIDLLRHAPQMQSLAQRLGEHLCFAEGNWERGLPWLLRGDRADVRATAERESRDPIEAVESIALGDAWFSLAERSPAEYRERVHARAVWRYATARTAAPPSQRQRLENRIAEVLPALPERRMFYFLPETEVRGIPADEMLRQHGIVVEGHRRAYALWAHPPANGSSHVRFDVPQGNPRLVGAAAIDDRALQNILQPLTFRILADGRQIWKSQPSRRAGWWERFDVNVAGVKSLEFIVDCPGPNASAYAIWLEPQLLE